MGGRPGLRVVDACEPQFELRSNINSGHMNSRNNGSNAAIETGSQSWDFGYGEGLGERAGWRTEIRDPITAKALGDRGRPSKASSWGDSIPIPQMAGPELPLDKGQGWSRSLSGAELIAMG